MNAPPFKRIKLAVCLILLPAFFAGGTIFAADAHWVSTWGCGVMLTGSYGPPPPGLTSNTLRQVVHVTIGGKRLRVRFSNAYGATAVVMNSVHVALNAGATAKGTTNPATDRALTFQGQPSVVIPPGQVILSDPCNFDLPPLADLTVTIYFGATPSKVTGHPASFTTSYLWTNNAVAFTNMTGAVKTTRWFFLTGVDVLAGSSSRALVALGDSLTDGDGTTMDRNNRWPDDLAARLHTNAPTAGVAVVNMGICGNGMFYHWSGPPAIERFDRDVLNQNGVHWVIVFEGVNDIILDPNTSTVATNLIASYRQLIAKAHAHPVRVYGTTITPFGGSKYYTDAREAVRQTVNTWIRTNHLYDAVIDFDAVVRDPDTLTNLRSAYDKGDHLHLNPAGYRALAEAIDLNWFRQ